MRLNFRTYLRNEVFSLFTRSTKISKICESTIFFADVYRIFRGPIFPYDVEQDPKMFMAN